jgi:hypothetical protein
LENLEYGRKTFKQLAADIATLQSEKPGSQSFTKSFEILVGFLDKQDDRFKKLPSRAVSF